MPLVTESDPRKDPLPLVLLAFLLLLLLVLTVVLAQAAWSRVFPPPPTPMRPVAAPATQPQAPG